VGLVRLGPHDRPGGARGAGQEPGALLRRGRVAWAGGLLAYAAAAGAMAWGAAHGWDARAFRVYYLGGGLLTAPLLGVGSLLLWGRAWAAPVGLVYTGLAIGVAVAMPVHDTFGHAIPAAQDHVGWIPRAVAIGGNSLGTLAVVVVAVATFARRPLGNALILAGVTVAGLGSALAGTGVAATAVFVAVAVVLLYLGVRPRGQSGVPTMGGGAPPPPPLSGATAYAASNRSKNER
jgi:hypothetical protein